MAAGKVGAPVGNSNAAGKHNGHGGRMTKKDEEWHVRLWEGMKDEDGNLVPWDVEELEKKIASKKYVGRDMYALRVLKADPMILRNLADKVLATLHDHDMKQTVIFEQTIYDRGNTQANSIPVLSEGISNAALGSFDEGQKD